MRYLAHSAAVGLLLLFVAVTPARSQLYKVNWSRIDGPSGRSVLGAIAFHPSGVLFAQADGLYRSEDHGYTWTPVDSMPKSGRIWIQPDGTVYASGPHLYRSTDVGGTWQRLYTMPIQASISAFIRLPNGAMIFCIDGHAVLKSSDDGGTWIAIADQHNPHGLYLGLRGFLRDTSGVILASSEDHLFRSTDDGETWGFATLGLLPEYTFPTVAQGADGWVWIASSRTGMVARSSDAGRTWHRMVTEATNRIHGISPRGHIYGAPTAKYSTDAVASWRTFSGSSLIGVAFLGDDEIVAAIHNSAPLRSTDAGLTWRPVRTPVLTARIIGLSTFGRLSVVAAAARAVWFSDDGSYWRSSSAVPPGSIHAVVGGDSTFVATDSGLFRTTDQGRSWHSIDLGISPVPVTALAGTDRELLVGTATGALLRYAAGVPRLLGAQAEGPVTAIARTQAGGIVASAGRRFLVSADQVTWRFAEPDTAIAAIHSLAVAESNMVVAGTSKGVLASYDGGVTWASVSTGSPAYAVMIDDRVRIWQANDQGLCALSQGDTIWKAFDDLLAGRIINALAFQAIDEGVILAGTDGDGVYRGSYHYWIDGVGIDDNIAGLQCIPNPGSGRTRVDLQCVRGGHCRISLVDRLGRMRLGVFDGPLHPGGHSFPIDASGLERGAWFLNVTMDGSRTTVPLVFR